MAETETRTARRKWYRILGAIVVCAAVMTLGVFLWTRPHVEVDERRLQGVWVSDKLRLTFTGDLVVHDGFGEPREYLFRLEPRATPKRIILYPTCYKIRAKWYILGMPFGPLVSDPPGGEGHAIYELEGDRLRICFPRNPSGDFPKSFAPSTGNIQEYHRP